MPGELIKRNLIFQPLISRCFRKLLFVPSVTIRTMVFEENWQQLHDSTHNSLISQIFKGANQKVLLWSVFFSFSCQSRHDEKNGWLVYRGHLPSIWWYFGEVMSCNWVMEKRVPDCFGYIGDKILPSFKRIIPISHFKGSLRTNQDSMERNPSVLIKLANPHIPHTSGFFFRVYSLIYVGFNWIQKFT